MISDSSNNNQLPDKFQKNRFIQIFVIFCGLERENELRKSDVATLVYYTAQKMKFFITDFFSKCDQIRWKLGIWSHLLKKSVTENFIFLCIMHCVILFFEKSFCDQLLLVNSSIQWLMQVHWYKYLQDYRKSLSSCKPNEE